MKLSSQSVTDGTFRLVNHITTSLDFYMGSPSLPCEHFIRVKYLRYFRELLEQNLKWFGLKKTSTQLFLALAKNPGGVSTFIEMLSTCEVITPETTKVQTSLP